MFVILFVLGASTALAGDGGDAVVQEGMAGEPESRGDAAGEIQLKHSE